MMKRIKDTKHFEFGLTKIDYRKAYWEGDKIAYQPMHLDMHIKGFGMSTQELCALTRPIMQEAEELIRQRLSEL
jgi:hypothetical protein